MVDSAEHGHALLVRANSCPPTADAAACSSSINTARSGRLVAIPNEWNWAVITVDAAGIDLWYATFWLNLYHSARFEVVQRACV